MWTDVREIDRNGIIVAFEIQFIPLNTFEGVLVRGIVNVPASRRSIMLRDLEEYVPYNITVRARTSVGRGPYSSAITERTLEDGRILFYLLFNAFILIFYFFSSTLQFSKQCHNNLCIIDFYWSNVGECSRNR